MAVQFANPPEQATAALSLGLIDLRSTGFLAAELERIFAGGQPRIEQKFAHPVYYLALGDLIKFQEINSPKLIAWKYFLSEDLVAEVNVTSLPDRFKLGTVCTGSCTLPRRVFEEVTQDPAFQHGVYHARTLHLFDLHFSAIWLKSEQLAGDSFFPLGTSRELTGDLERLTTDDFKRILIPAALSKLALIENQGNLLA